MNDVVIGVDVGSTAIKVILLDIAGNQMQAPVSALLPGSLSNVPGRYEYLADAIMEQTAELIQRAVANCTCDIVAIAITGQMHGGLLVDSELQPITPFVSWQDKRGDDGYTRDQSIAEWLMRIRGHDPTSTGIRTGYLASTILWWKLNGEIKLEHAIPLGIYDWITSNFVGRAVTDIASAAAWGMYDPIRLDWCHPVLDAIGINPQFLPGVAEPHSLLGTIAPTWAKKLGVSESVQVFATTGDTQAAFIGSGTQPGELLLNIGTGSQSLWMTDRREATFGTDLRYLRNQTFIATAPTLAGGKALALLIDFYQSVLQAFGVERSQQDIYEVVNRVTADAGANGVVCDPIFAGSRYRTPIQRASFQNLRADNFNIANISRALLEGMVEEIAAPFLASGDPKPHAIVVAGNAMDRNPVLQEIAKARFGVGLRPSRFSEAAACGAALGALGQLT